MSYETHTTTVPSFSDAVSAASGKAGQSGGSPALSEWFVSKEELALPSEVIHLGPSSIPPAPFWKHKYYLLVYLEDEHYAEAPTVHLIVSDDTFTHQAWSPLGTSGFQTRFNWDVIETSLEEIYSPTFEDSSGGFSFAYFLPETLLPENPAPARLDSALHASFEAEPLEDGMSHPAEGIVDLALQSGEGLDVLGWLRGFCLDIEQPTFAASVLRCLGRQIEPGTDSWRASLIRDCLAMSNIEIRDAAVQAAESWGDSGLVTLLESHSETVTWLQEYILDVIDDLRK